LSESLIRLGWTPERETEFDHYREDGLRPARVAVEHRSAYVLYGERGEFRAELAGRLRHEETWPAVGDWVGVREPETIAAVLPRRTVFSRKEPWLAAKEQVTDSILDKCKPIAGTPEECIAAIEEYKDAGCTHVMLELWGDRRHEQIRLFGEQVLPHVR